MARNLEKIIELWNEGKTIEEVANEFQLTKGTLYSYLDKGRKKGLKVRDGRKDGTKHRESEERAKKIVELWNSGLSIDEISNQLGISKSTIDKTLSQARKQGLIIRDRIKKVDIESEKRDKKIVELWNLGFSRAEISNQLGISKGTIDNTLSKARKQGLKIRDGIKNGIRKIRSEERAKKIVELWNSGLSRAEISNQLGISKSTIDKTLSKAREQGLTIRDGIKERHIKSEEIAEKIVELWNSGLSIDEISNRLEIKKTTVYRKLYTAKKQGLEVRDEKISRQIKIEERFKKIIELWNLGLSRTEISNQLRISKAIIDNTLSKARKQGLKIRDGIKCSISHIESEEISKKIIELWNSGSSKTDISKQFGIKESTVYQILYRAKKQGIEVRNETNVRYIRARERTKKIVELWNSGSSKTDISKQFGIKESTVYHILYTVKKQGFEVRNEKNLNHIRGEERVKKIVELWNSGMTEEEIAKKLGLTIGTINNALNKAKEQGLNVRDKIPEGEILQLWNSGMYKNEIMDELKISSAIILKTLRKARKQGMYVRDGSKDLAKSRKEKNPQKLSSEKIEDKVGDKREERLAKFTQEQTDTNEKTKQSIDERIKKMLTIMLPLYVAEALHIKPYVVYNLYDSLSAEEQKQIKIKFLTNKKAICQFLDSKRKEGLSLVQALKNLEYETNFKSYKDLSEFYFVLGDETSAIRVINQILYDDTVKLTEQQKKAIESFKQIMQKEILSQKIRKDYYKNQNIDGTKISWNDLCHQYDKVDTNFLLQVLGMEREDKDEVDK